MVCAAHEIPSQASGGRQTQGMPLRAGKIFGLYRVGHAVGRYGGAMKVHEVFGIKPSISELSYIDRGSLDKEFRKLVDRQQTHIAIRGASKAGKSWLRQRVLDDPIIVQCRLSYTTLDIYRDG